MALLASICHGISLISFRPSLVTTSTELAADGKSILFAKKRTGTFRFLISSELRSC